MSNTTIPGYAIREFIEKYKITKPSIKNLKYRADYLYYGPYERGISDFKSSEYPELKSVYSNSSVEIYKILQ